MYALFKQPAMYVRVSIERGLTIYIYIFNQTPVLSAKHLIRTLVQRMHNPHAGANSINCYGCRLYH